MNDSEVIQKRHWYCEENNLIIDWQNFREEKEKSHNTNPQYHEMR